MKTAKKCFALALAFVLTLSAASALPARTARADAGGPVQVWYYDMPGWDAASQTLGDWYCLADDWAGHDNPGDPDNYWGPMPLHGAPGDGQFSYTFNGTGFEYYSSGGWINDSMDLLIDGELAWRFNWGDNRDGCIYSNMDLAPGEHTVTLKGNGNFLYFMIYGGGEDSGGAAVTGVSLDKTSASVAVGKTTQLTATVEPSDAADKAVSWKSSNEDIATVSQTGLVTAEAEGEADITATTDDGGFSAVCAVTVTPAASGGSLPTGNLLAWWDMDNLTGNTEYDKIGDAYDAVTDGADTEGVCNGALAFNGSSTMIDVARTLDGDTSVLDSAGVSVWINPASLPPAVYGNKYDNESILSSTEVNPDPEQYWLCAQGAFALELTPAGAIVARLWDNGGGAPIITAGSGFGSGVYDYGTFTTDDDVIKPNEWQNVAFSYDIGTQEATIYVNGTALVTATYSTAIQPDFNGLEIGMRSGPYAQGANYFNGSMDELMIYGRALSASDIAQIIAYDGSGYVAVPGATGLTVSGNAAVGETLTGSFRPTNGATTADSAYQWYSADTAAGEKTAIIGAESDTYTLTGGDAGKYIFFAVTPSDGETTGAAVYSSAFGPVKAAPSGLTLPDGAIAHWLLDDITDGGVLDEVSGVRDAITNGAAVAGVKDGGVGFAGDTQIAAAQVATTAGGDTLGAMTVSMWIKPTATNVQQLLFGAGDLNIQSNNGSFMIFLADGQIAAGISDGSWNGCTSDMLSDGRWSQILSSGANSVKASVWQNITVTYDNGAGAAPGVVQIYIDGKLKNSGTYAQENYPRPADVANIVIGAGAVTDGWGVANAAAGYGGAMDEALIYGRVLDASEVAQVYDYAKDGAAAAPTGLPADALAHWDMNDTQGGTLAYDSVNDVDNAIANGAAGEGVKDGGVDFTGGAAVADSTQIAAAQVGAAAGGDLGALSVSLWINPSTTSGQQLLFGTSGMNMQAGDGSFVILLADGQIAAGISDSSWNGCTSDMIPGGYWGYGWYPDGGTPHGMLLASGANSVKPGVWQNVTVTYDQGTGVEQIYMDGVLLNSGTYTYNPSLVSVANVVIGAGVVTDQAWVATSVGGYSGAMDEVMIYGRVLNPLEAGQIYDYAKDGVGPAAPSAWGVSVTYAGTAAIGTELTGVYTYNSADGEAEGASAYQWYRSLSSGSSGKSAIPGATGKTYTLTGDDSGNYVFFGVTPVSESGAKGIEAVSAGVYLRVSDGGNYIPLKPNMMTETAVGTYSPVLYAKDGFQWNGDFDSNYTQYTGVHIPVAGSNNPVSGISGDSDCSGDAYFAYDDNNFYMGVKVLDDTHTPGPVGRNWDGDGLQFAFADCAFASFRSEFGVALQSDGTFDIERDSDGMAVLTKDAIGMNFWRDEATHCTYYELCIPWMAVMSGPPPEGSTQRFTVAINDKDGDSGRGYVAWTDGIVSTKSIQDLANIELIPKETDPWSAWISGPAQVNAGTSGQYTLYVPNYSSETFAADVDLPEYTGTYQTHIEVPPGYAYKQVFTVYVPSDMDIHANITPVSGKAKTALLHVTAVLGAGDISDMFTDLETNILPALQELIGNVNAAGLTTQYEDIDATILGQYIVLGREDLANNRADRAQYIALTLYQLAAGATADLNAYLNGTKTPLESPTYVTPADAAGGAKPSSESYSMMGPTTDGERPIYFTGYGMFDRVIHDVPLFPQLGTNIVDVNFGPSGVIMQPGAMTSWGTWYDTGSSVYPPVFALDDTTSTDGNYSVKITLNGTSNAYLQQGIPIEQGAGYTVSGDFKIAPGSDFSDFTLWYFGYYTNSALFTANPDGSWTHFDLHITNTTYESTYIELFLGGSRTGTIWFDNIKLVKDGTTANLITSNPSFEDVIPTVGDYAVNAGGAEAFLIPFLDNAAANNVAVNLDLSYVNWPAWTYGPDAWPDIYAPYNQFGNKFDLENPRTWDIEKAFLDATIPIIKDNPALVSVTLSSEPAYYDDSTSVYHLQNYRDFLQNKYGAIDALNAVYGTSYLSFSEIPLPDVSKAAGTPVYYDYLTHKNDVFAQFHQMIADEIHLIAPDLPVHIKTMGWDLLNRTPLLTTGLDQEQLLAMSQISGTDNGNSRESGSSGYVQENSLYDWMMSLQKQPIFNSENHILTDGDETYAPEIAQSVGNQLWDGALHGATLSTLWVWDKSYDAVNQGYLMGSILNRPDAVQQVGKVNLDLNRLAYEVKAFQDAPAHVAILYSFSSNLYNDQYYSMYRRAYNALSYTGQKAAIITENQINKVSFGYDTSTGIGDIGAANSGMNAVINGAQVPTADTNDFSLDDYQVLILPEVTNLQADTLANIAAWVAKGGKVVTIGAPSTLLSKTELNQPQSASARSSVLDAAVPVAANPTESALRDVFFNVLGTLDLNETVVYDAATGAPADELEWRTVQYDGKTLLSIVNYTENDRDVTFKLNGADGKAVGELISANQMDGQVLRIAGLGHYIFVIEPVSQQPSNDAALASLTVSEGTLTPGFDAEITEYTVDVDNDADSIIITAAAHDPNAEVTGDTGTKNLTVGENTFTVTVTAEDGTTAQDYIITVNRAAPALIGAEVTSGPDKTVYDAGTLANIDDLDLTGLEVTFTYSDGTVNFLDGMGAGEFYSLSCDKDDFSAAGVYVVNVYADGQIIGSFTITVKAPAIDLSKYDINGDGKVDANDLALIMANLNKKASTNAVTMKCDLDGDGMVTIKDYQLLAGIIAGM